MLFFTLSSSCLSRIFADLLANSFCKPGQGEQSQKIDTIDNVSLEHCKRYCAEKTGCAAIDYSKTNRACRLYKANTPDDNSQLVYCELDKTDLQGMIL